MWCYHERWNQFRPKYGQPRTKLMELAHTPEEFLGLIDHSIKNYFPRPEYWRKDGRLFFSIYNGQYFVKMLGAKKVKAALAEARKRVRAAGLGEIEFNTQNVGPAASAQMAELGFDSLTDYGFGPWCLPNYKDRYMSGELLYNFADVGPYLEKRWADYQKGPLPYYPIVPTGWDSTPRCRPEEPFPWAGPKWNEYPYCSVYTNATPRLFESYLRAAKAAVENDPKRRRLHQRLERVHGGLFPAADRARVRPDAALRGSRVRTQAGGQVRLLRHEALVEQGREERPGAHG